MNRANVRSILLGFLGAVGVLGCLLYVIGVQDFLRELSRADGEPLVLVLVVTLAWLAAWGFSLKSVLGILDIEFSFPKSFLVLNGAMFSNNITPFGQAGGEPITALLISKLSEAEYERGLAAIASVDTLNFLPSITLALFGAGYYATQTTFTQRLQITAAGVVALGIGAPLVGYVGWQNRRTVQTHFASGLSRLISRLATVVPGVSAATQEGIHSRLDHFIESIERIATDRTSVGIALCASTLGWLFQMVALWLAFVAIGRPVPFTVMLFVIPVGAIASITPLPGGVGGIEAVLVGLLSTLPGLTVGWESALAAVVIFRGAVYWVPVIIGGIVVSVIGADSVQHLNTRQGNG